MPIKYLNRRAALRLIVRLGAFAMLAPIAAWAQSDFKLALPIDCKLGKTCWLVNLVDADPGPGTKDYLCKAQSYNTHKGTDISVRDLKVMKKGVRVLAAAPGIVRATRDGMADQNIAVKGAKPVKGRECGNGVAIEHERGWTTQYCHMRKGSVVVKKGDKIKKGQKLGLVGHSGLAAFPHVHMTVRHLNRVIDPFVGKIRTASCGLGANHLWQPNLVAELTQPMTAIYSAGFAGVPPKKGGILAGLYQDKALSPKAPAFILWASIYRTQKGDLVRMQIKAPNGRLVHFYESTINKTQARRMIFSGKKRKSKLWPEGLYKGQISLHRKAVDGSENVFKVERQVWVR